MKFRNFVIVVVYSHSKIETVHLEERRTVNSEFKQSNY